MTESQYEWVRSESESRDCSMAKVVRDLINAQRNDASEYRAEQPYESIYDEVAYHRERLKRLETRLAELEQQVDTQSDSERESRSQSSSEISEYTEGISSGLETLPEAFQDEVLARLEGGSKVNRNRLHREAIRTANWLRNQDAPMTRSDFIAALCPEDLSEKTWWRRYARTALNQMVSQGLVTYREGQYDYAWEGTDE